MQQNALLSGDLHEEPFLNDDKQTWQMWMWWGVFLTFDLCAFLLLWYLVQCSIRLTWMQALALLVVVILVGSLWRFHRARLRFRNDLFAGLPYPCGAIAVDKRELVIVATVHISPRATKDVETVLCNCGSFDVVMIELDEERLEQMRFAEAKTKDLQPMTVTTGDGREPLELFAQRATWNNCWKGKTISGPIIFNTNDPHGAALTQKHSAQNHGLASNEIGTSSDAHLALVKASGPNGQVIPATQKVYNAWRTGAQALVVISGRERLPSRPVGEEDMWQDLKVAMRTHNFGYPQIPVLVLPHTAGMKLHEACLTGQDEVHGKFEVLGHDHPWRTFRRRVGLECAFALSGVSILYGVVDCLGGESGTEFIKAEAIATEKKMACECIDVTIDNLCERLKHTLLPTPYNIGAAVVSWLALPRVLWWTLFPPLPTTRDNGSGIAHLSVDTPGTVILHMWSFRCRTWFAFLSAVFLSGMLLFGILKLIGSGAESAAEETGASKSDRREFMAWIMIGIELYALPRAYEAVASSRDNAMYRRLVSAVRRRPVATRFAVVVGAAHANGILNMLKQHGF